MKHTIFYLCLAILTIALLNGCKKDDIKQNQTSVSKISYEKIRAWFEAQPGALTYQKIEIEGKEIKVYEKIIWGESEYFPEAKTVITPVSIISLKEIIPVFKYLVTTTDEAGNIIEGKYCIIHSNKSLPIPNIYKTIINHSNNLEYLVDDFTGGIINYDLHNNLISSNNYNKGSLSNKNDKISIRKSKNQIPVENNAPVECYDITIDWYWQTWENGILIYEEYLFSTTYNTCGSEGGGGNGGGGSGNSCNFTSAQGEELLSYVTYQYSYFATNILGQPTTLSNGVIKAPNPIEWQFLTLHVFGNYYPKYKAYFSGTVYKLNANDPNWKWEKVSFTHIAKSQGEVPPCFEVAVTAGATSIISGNELSVQLDVNFQSTTTVTCLFGTEVAHYNDTVTYPNYSSNNPGQ